MTPRATAALPWILPLAVLYAALAGACAAIGVWEVALFGGVAAVVAAVAWVWR